MTNSEDYRNGQLAFHAFTHSRHFAQFDRDARATDVMRLFWPPVPEDNMQIQRPLPKPRREWLQGFEDARKKNESN